MKYYSKISNIVLLLCFTSYPIVRIAQSMLLADDVFADITVALFYGIILFATFFVSVLPMIIWLRKHDKSFGDDFDIARPFSKGQLYGRIKRYIFAVLIISLISESILSIMRLYLGFNYSESYFHVPIIIFLIFTDNTALSAGLSLRLTQLAKKDS